MPTIAMKKYLILLTVAVVLSMWFHQSGTERISVFIAGIPPGIPH